MPKRCVPLCEVRHLDCPGQIHTSLMAVGAIASAAPARRQLATALEGFLRTKGVRS
jgi:hypothetical protein